MPGNKQVDKDLLNRLDLPLQIQLADLRTAISNLIKVCNKIQDNNKINYITKVFVLEVLKYVPAILEKLKSLDSNLDTTLTPDLKFKRFINLTVWDGLPDFSKYLEKLRGLLENFWKNFNELNQNVTLLLDKAQDKENRPSLFFQALEAFVNKNKTFLRLFPSIALLFSEIRNLRNSEVQSTDTLKTVWMNASKKILGMNNTLPEQAAAVIEFHQHVNLVLKNLDDFISLGKQANEFVGEASVKTFLERISGNNFSQDPNYVDLITTKNPLVRCILTEISRKINFLAIAAYFVFKEIPQLLSTNRQHLLNLSKQDDIGAVVTHVREILDALSQEYRTSRLFQLYPEISATVIAMLDELNINVNVSLAPLEQVDIRKKFQNTFDKTKEIIKNNLELYKSFKEIMGLLKATKNNFSQWCETRNDDLYFSLSENLSTLGELIDGVAEATGEQSYSANFNELVLAIDNFTERHGVQEQQTPNPMLMPPVPFKQNGSGIANTAPF